MQLVDKIRDIENKTKQGRISISIYWDRKWIENKEITLRVATSCNAREVIRNGDKIVAKERIANKKVVAYEEDGAKKAEDAQQNEIEAKNNAIKNEKWNFLQFYLLIY